MRHCKQISVISQNYTDREKCSSGRSSIPLRPQLAAVPTIISGFPEGPEISFQNTLLLSTRPKMCRSQTT